MTTVIKIASGASASEIQAALDSAPRYATVELSAGTYLIDEPLVMNTDGLKLVGDPGGGTILVGGRELGDEPMIRMGHELFKEDSVAQTDLASGAKAGTKQIKLTSGHDVQAGDYVYLSMENTDTFLDAIGDEAWRKDQSLRSYLAPVEEVNGNTVVLASELNFDFDPQITRVETRHTVENMALRDLTLVGDWGEADPSDFNNRAPSADRHAMVQVNGTSGTKIVDIDIQDAASHGIELSASTGVTVHDVTVDGAVNKGAGGNGYGIHIRDVYDSSFTDLTVVDTRHAVVFGSYSSATGNTVQVDYTNRDINFHGGRDHTNTVHVDKSIRNEVESDYMSPNLFFNSGTSYGAPTDASANTVTFGRVEGTVRSDLAFAQDSGSFIKLRDGADHAVTGDGDDVVWAGSGHDTVVASLGDDRLELGGGKDTVIFTGSTAHYQTRWDGDTLVVNHSGGRTTIRDAERVEFNGRSYAFHEVPETDISKLFEEKVLAGLEVMDGGASWERYSTDDDVWMGDDLNALVLTGANGQAAIGNAMNNHILGSAAGDWIEGRDGQDRLVGRQGDDTILGGDGDDELFGGNGDDVLFGGLGSDKLYGGTGADTFVAGPGSSVIMDFNREEGDQITFQSDPSGSFMSAFDDFIRGDDLPGSYTAESYLDNNGDLVVTFENGLGETVSVYGLDSDILG